MTIRLRKVRSGNSLNVIVINGFLSEKNTDITDWLNVLDWDFQSTTVHHYDWDACNSKKILKTVGTGNLGLRSSISTTAMRITKTVSPYLTAGIVGTTAAVGFYEWRKAMKNAKLAGERLAKHIDKQEGRFILLGHSLGSRVIFHCLQSQQTRNKVMGAMLFGGAVGKENSWGHILQKHSKISIFNCYSTNDLVLKTLYPVGTLKKDSPIGLSPISQGYQSRLHNVDMSNIVSGHMKYKTSEVGRLLGIHMASTR